MSIGKRIKELRLQKNFTLEYVGGIIGASKQNLYKYENEIITNIPSDKIEKLAVLYEVSPCYIMGWEIPQKAESALSEAETAIIKKYNGLNEKGKEYINDQFDFALSQDKYRAKTEEVPPEASAVSSA